MPALKVGDLIGIPCTVSDGPFESELLVEFETMDGTISGFTASENVKEINGQLCIRAEILAVESEHYLVKVDGSFFSTNGLANVAYGKPLPLAA